MKKHKTALALGGLLSALLIVLGGLLHWRSVRDSWQGNQLQNAASLGRALAEYHQKHGTYPETLTVLVDDGVVSKEEFDRLQFRALPDADPEPWLYRPPTNPTEIAMVAPQWVRKNSNQDLDALPVARADGGAELIWRSKHVRIPDWARKDADLLNKAKH